MAGNTLPLIICGPVLRRLQPGRIVLWWISRIPLTGEYECFNSASSDSLFSTAINKTNTRILKIGTYAHVHLLDMQIAPELPVNQKIGYNLTFDIEDTQLELKDLMPDLIYPGEKHPCFFIKTKIDKLFHGSCRNPHHSSDDSMIGADREIKEALNSHKNMPALLMLTGDQIYADDVAGPMLHAIHQTIALLGLNHEAFTGTELNNSKDLYANPDTYYSREKILPKTKVGKRWYNRGGRYPVFTSFFAHNHLITFAEFMAMYILVWSRAMWDLIDLNSESVPEQFRTHYEKEQLEIEKFIDALPNTQRVMAHVPCYMIFDDHDITDDWNMTAQWEKAAYENPFSKRIIGNGLMAYWICQGWGNSPESFETIYQTHAGTYFKTPSTASQEDLIDTLLKFDQWHFDLPTQPRLVVIDSRTRRWRSETRLSNPSGLLDWEALSELQQTLIDDDAVILVAPAPIFGVKLIEMIQNIFSFFGYPLVVDAENWMAHKGTAYALLQIFKHIKTPDNFVILSGDVHYSFAYDVVIRFRDNSPRIWQITSSGIKNEFPGNLLKWLDKLNRWLYAPYSPLNIFTKRRDMKVRHRIPKGKGERRLINTSGIGLVCLDDKGAPTKIQEIYANDSALDFIPKKQSAKPTTL